MKDLQIPQITHYRLIKAYSKYNFDERDTTERGDELIEKMILLNFIGASGFKFRKTSSDSYQCRVIFENSVSEDFLKQIMPHPAA